MPAGARLASLLLTPIRRRTNARRTADEPPRGHLQHERLLARAAQLMWDHDFGALPVVDADGRLVGMITDRDICMAAYLRGQPLHDISVE